jgi:hypothetical protein
MINRFKMAPSTEAIRRWGPPALGTLVATAALMALTAAAPVDAAARPERTTETAAPRQAGEPLMAIVSLKSQKVTFYDADGWILRAPVSTGLQRRGEGQGPPLEPL